MFGHAYYRYILEGLHVANGGPSLDPRPSFRFYNG